jgi:hypothetical protein
MTQSPDRAELPIPDYDHLPVGSLQHRLRALDETALVRLAAYEREHANRLNVLNLIQARREQLAGGASPSDGDPAAVKPELAPGPDTGSRVSPETSGPPMNPPSQGVPSNPAQPRSTG